MKNNNKQTEKTTYEEMVANTKMNTIKVAEINDDDAWREQQ